MIGHHRIILLKEGCSACEECQFALAFLGLSVNAITLDTENWQADLTQHPTIVIVCAEIIKATPHLKSIFQHPLLAILSLGELPANTSLSFSTVIALPLKKENLLKALYQATHFLQDKHAPDPFTNILVSHSDGMRLLRKTVAQVANTPVNVLITGEIGTGKEDIAVAIHRASTRKEQPLVPIHCSAIPEELLVYEIWGDMNDTVALTKKRPGRLLLAEGGTLFLDDIDHLPLALQRKLLHTLQAGYVENLHGERLPLNVRVIIAALDQDLSSFSWAERLNLFPLKTLPLREHLEDLPCLIEHMLVMFQQQLSGTLLLTDETLSVMSQYSWPGNLQELSDLIEYLMVLYPQGVITPQELPRKFFKPTPPVTTRITPHDDSENLTKFIETLSKNLHEPLKEVLMKAEVAMINAALARCTGNISQAAKQLGLGRTTLIEKMRKYHLSHERESFFS